MQPTVPFLSAVMKTMLSLVKMATFVDEMGMVRRRKGVVDMTGHRLHNVVVRFRP